MSFVTAALLGGLVFAAAPIIIHLLNRRRFTLVEWAPMEYLRLTLRTNRRRLQLEQWVLLAIRTLVILLLIFAVARPLLAGGGAAKWLTFGGRTSRVLIIDDSLSMGLSNNSKTAFDRAKETAASAIESLGTQDALTVLTTSGINNPLQRETTLNAGEAEALANDVRGLEVSDTANNWASTLSNVADMLEGAAHTSREIRIITDQRAEGWSADAEEQAQRLEAMGVKLTIINVGQPSLGNASLAEFSQVTGVALATADVIFNAKLVTDGDAVISGAKATLVVDGAENTIDLPEVGPGSTHDYKFTLSFDDPGQHTVELRLPSDAMQGDNIQSLVVNVKPAVSVLIVDGQPAMEPRDGEGFYLAVSYMIGDVPIVPTIMTDSEWLSERGVGFYDLVVLANLEQVPADRAQQLYEAVEAGMGLMIFTGDQVDPGLYNQTLYAQGNGVLPGLIDEGEAVETDGILIERVDGSPLTAIFTIPPHFFTEVSPHKITPVEIEEGQTDVRVLAHWNNTDQPPAIVEKRVGRGSCLLWTLSADAAWSDWPKQLSFVPAVREASLSIAGVGEAAGNLTAGEPIRQSRGISSNIPPTSAQVLAAGQEQTVPAVILDEDADRMRIQYDDTARAGLYTLTWDKADEVITRTFAVSPDTRESNLKQISDEELQANLPGVDLEIIDQSDDAADGQNNEIWRTLALLLLGFIVIESAFATWVGREH